MKRMPLLVLLLTCGVVAACAQEPCQFFGDAAREALTQRLEAAPSCKEAAAEFDRCRWGSSADTGFGSIVVSKCEKELAPKLSPTGKANLQHEMSLCSYEYAKQEGTLYISEQWSCQVDAAASFAADPTIADQPPARASFDCGKAQSAMEQAICADPKLGDADIVLNRSWHAVMSALEPEERAALMNQQQDWLAGVRKKCSVGTEELPAAARTCVRKQFEERFLELDGCGAGETAACLKLPKAGIQQ
jgi:uncharacterized protein YecT (DUF1311 family)